MFRVAALPLSIYVHILIYAIYTINIYIYISQVIHYHPIV